MLDTRYLYNLHLTMYLYFILDILFYFLLIHTPLHENTINFVKEFKRER